MRDERFHDLAIRDALGELDDEERAAFDAERRRRGAPGDVEVTEIREALGAYALDARPVSPSPALRDRVLEAVDREASADGEVGVAPIGRRAVWPWIVITAAAAGVALWLGVRTARIEDERARLVDELERARSALAVAESTSSELRGDLRLLAEPASSIRALVGTGSVPDARARVFVDPATGRALLFAYELPVLSADEVYELWAFEDGTPRPAGVFRPNADGTARLEVTDPTLLEGIDAFAVTVEPAPGVETPTGEIVLSSS